MFLEFTKLRREGIYKSNCRGLIRDLRLEDRDVGAAQLCWKLSKVIGVAADVVNILDTQSIVPTVRDKEGTYKEDED